MCQSLPSSKHVILTSVACAVGLLHFPVCVFVFVYVCVSVLYYSSGDTPHFYMKK